jgi:hypothetical protein
MSKVKIYTHKISTSVRANMSKLTSNECVLVEREKKMNDNEHRASNCHRNVDKYVENYGGKRVGGWLLARNKKFTNCGLWLWSFHSVWQNKDGELLDVTKDANYTGAFYSTFWIDSYRVADLKTGVSHNNVITFENDAIAAFCSQVINFPLAANDAYWTTQDMGHYKKITEHSGEYKLLREEYPHNSDAFERDYKMKVVNGTVQKADGASRVSNDCLFDYSVSLRNEK